jgi:hypothetical protein
LSLPKDGANHDDSDRRQEQDQSKAKDAVSLGVHLPCCSLVTLHPSATNKSAC